jgi:hypothetical protein
LTFIKAAQGSSALYERNSVPSDIPTSFSSHVFCLSYNSQLVHDR